MKKFIRTGILAELARIMRKTGYTLSQFNGDNIDTLQIFVLCTYHIVDNKYSIAVENDDIKLMITFIINNYGILEDNGNILDVMSKLCSALQRKPVSKAKKSVSKAKEELYFQMGLDEKIRSIKALRELTKMGFDFVPDGGLKWAKEAVEEYVIFGPVSEKFIAVANNLGHGQYIINVSNDLSIMAGIMYKDFMQKYNPLI